MKKSNAGRKPLPPEKRKLKVAYYLLPDEKAKVDEFVKSLRA